MGVGRIISSRGHPGIFHKFFWAGPKEVKFDFSHSKLRKQPFFAKNFKIQWSCIYKTPLLHRPDDYIGFTPSCPPTLCNKIAPMAEVSLFLRVSLLLTAEWTVCFFRTNWCMRESSTGSSARNWSVFWCVRPRRNENQHWKVWVIVSFKTPKAMHSASEGKYTTAGGGVQVYLGLGIFFGQSFWSECLKI